ADARRRTHEDRQQRQRTHPAEARARGAARSDRQSRCLRFPRWLRPRYGRGRVLRPSRTVPEAQLPGPGGVGVPPGDRESRAVATRSSAVANLHKIGGIPRGLECGHAKPTTVRGRATAGAAPLGSPPQATQPVPHWPRNSPPQVIDRIEVLVAGTQAGWYDDGTGTKRWYDGEKW